jgi:hypothetical protein
MLEALIKAHLEAVVDEELESAMNIYFDREELEKAKDRYSFEARHERCVQDATTALRFSIVKEHPRIKAQKDAIDFREQYCRAVFEDAEESRVIRGLLLMKLKSEISTLNKHDDSNSRFSEYLTYHILSEIESGNIFGEDSDNRFELFLKTYCTEKQEQITDGELKGLVADKKALQNEAKALEFVLETSKTDQAMHIMLIKYYEAVNNRTALLEACDSAVKNFNEPWFAYKFAEHVENNDGNYFDIASFKLTEIKKTGADKDKYRIHINVGNFFLRTGISIEDLQEAKKAYENALSIKPGPSSVSYSELSAKISEIENCINAAKEIEPMLYPKPEKYWLTGQAKPPKKLSTERRASMWETLMGNYILLKGYLKRHNDQHPYAEQIRKDMGKFASQLLKDIRERIKEDEVEKRALKKMIYHLKEKRKEDKSRKAAYERRIDNYQKNIDEIEHTLIPYKRKYEKIVDSVLQIFPELDRPK